MIQRFLALVLFCCAIVVPAAEAQRQAEMATQKEHVAWVAGALKRMQTIKPGMTRADLLKVFTKEGGTFTRLQRTFVSRDCPYFKVDVQFEAVGQASRDANGRLIERDADKIIKISRPFLQFSIVD